MAKHLHIITTYIENVFTNNQSDENTKSHTKLQSLVNESQIHLKTDYYKHFKHQQKKTTNMHTFIYTYNTHTLTHQHKQTYKIRFTIQMGGKNGLPLWAHSVWQLSNCGESAFTWINESVCFFFMIFLSSQLLFFFVSFWAKVCWNKNETRKEEEEEKKNNQTNNTQIKPNQWSRIWYQALTSRTKNHNFKLHIRNAWTAQK